MLAVADGDDDERQGRSRIAALLAYGELVLETAVAFALGAGGGLLLVFIFTELINTIRVVIARRALEVEPFLIVGIVAAIRRLIVVSAEAENLLGTSRFRDVMLEIGVLAGAALVLGTTVLLLRIARRWD